MSSGSGLTIASLKGNISQHTDKSKTHLFFKYISGLKVQFIVKLWSVHPNLCFVEN